MKEKLVIITLNSTARIGLLSYLSSIFHNYLEIESVLLPDVTPNLLASTSCVLYSAADIQPKCQDMVPDHVHELICIRTFNHTYLHKILQIPPGSFVYLVNDSERNTYEVIRQLQDFGISQYHFLPYYPGCGPVSSEIKYAVTVGEVHLVPKNISTVIDIGNRVVDISTINEIIAWYHLPLNLADEITRNYINHIVQIIKLSNMQLSHALDTQMITQAIINTIVNGICLIDSNDSIQMVNHPFTSMLCLLDQELIGQSLPDLLEEHAITCDLHDSSEFLLRNANGELIRLWIQEIDTINTSRMYLIHSYRANDAGEQMDDTIPGSMVRRLYDFNHIITQTPSVLHLIENAKRISLNDFHVIIQGESGTEKEVLAQAIHNNSRRHDAPFVTLNLTSLETAIINTELLGYEDGAFPGSRPGGMTGILESADGGTLFIDGIQYMPHHIQAILLHVLRNGTLKRIGGSRTIPVNIRVIATTTRDLYQMVQEGSFIDELFFTINSVSLITIPLRQREEDIPLLLNHFLKNVFNNYNINAENIMSEHLLQYLKQYSWPGNTQELNNLCRHFFSIYNREPLSLQNLPPYIINQITATQSKLSIAEKQILKLIAAAPHIGRSGIKRQLEENGVSITEGKIRSTLQILNEYDYIKVHRTRGGCEITELGQVVLG
ncbi:MAG: sigma 54-interacting transcriptional regulator [Clostridiaceae bacterium]|nr:sigma 54-interacting transcriptional regulator [Clostridiaceae bacterium]